MTINWRMPLILLIYLSLTTAHSLTVPLTTGNDEWAHFQYLRFIAENHRLPATWEERATAGYKADAPPLYPMLVAALTTPVEPTPLLRRLDSPRRHLADNDPDPYAIVPTGVQLWPFHGEVLLWHLGRGVSILCGMLLILLTYRTARDLALSRHQATLAAAMLAFIPAFIFHSSVLSYESLSALLTAAFLWVGLRALRHPERRRWWLLLGLLAGLSITTKYSALLLPLEIGLIALLGRNLRHLWPRLAWAALMLMVGLGWWFGFVLWQFNTITEHGPLVGIIEPLLIGDASDTTSIEVAAFLFGDDLSTASRPPRPRHYPELLRQFIDSFWAAPVAERYLFSPWLSGLVSGIALLGLLGLIRHAHQSNTLTRRWLILLIFHTLLITPLLLIRLIFSYDAREVAQGRHLLMPAASAIPILLILGMQQLPRSRLPQRLLVALLLWSAAGQLGGAALSYRPPMPIWSTPAEAAHTDTAHATYLEEAIQLVDYHTQPRAAGLEVTLWWRAQAVLHADYLVELRLHTAHEELIGVGVGHPIQGRYPTRAWEPHDLIQDLHLIPLSGELTGHYQLSLRLLNRESLQPVTPATDLGPIELNWRGSHQPCASWGLESPLRERANFSVWSQEPPRLHAADGRTETPRFSHGNIHTFIVAPDWYARYELLADGQPCGPVETELRPRQFVPPAAIATPLMLNFNGQIELLGYELPTRRIPPGGRLPLTLYWRSLTYLGYDYTIFDNLLDAEQQRWGGYDRRPRDGYSTLLWVPGEIIPDPFGVPVDPAAPPGIYTIDLGLYRQTEQGLQTLPLFAAGQPTDENSLRIGPIKVGGPPPGVVLAPPAVTPEVNINELLGDNEIKLLGYDLHETESDMLRVTLYWQAERRPTADYTTFLHLRNGTNETIAQKDSPPAQNRYPTSLWEAEEIIADEISLDISELPPSEYRLVVGLYNSATLERLPLSADPAHTEITLQTIELTP